MSLHLQIIFTKTFYPVFKSKSYKRFKSLSRLHTILICAYSFLYIVLSGTAVKLVTDIHHTMVMIFEVKVIYEMKVTWNYVSK